MKAVILIGDSIRMGYQETVREQLGGRAGVWGPAENGGTSEYELLGRKVAKFSMNLLGKSCA